MLMLMCTLRKVSSELNKAYVNVSVKANSDNSNENNSTDGNKKSFRGVNMKSVQK